MSSMVQVLDWQWTGTKLVPEPMVIKFCDRTYITLLGNSELKIQDK